MSFSSLFEEHSSSEEVCLFELWVLSQQSRPSRVLYGRVVAKSHENPSRSWSGPRRGHSVFGDKRGPHIHKLHLTARACAIRALIEGLLAQKTLGDATRQAGLSLMSGHFSVHASCQLAPCYISRPVVFLEQHRPDHEQSPSDYMGMHVHSWIAMDKTQVWPNQPLNLSLRCLYEHLQTETGARFMGSDFGKLGNIDWFFSPGWNTHLDSD